MIVEEANIEEPGNDSNFKFLDSAESSRANRRLNMEHLNNVYTDINNLATNKSRSKINFKSQKDEMQSIANNSRTINRAFKSSLNSSFSAHQLDDIFLSKRQISILAQGFNSKKVSNLKEMAPILQKEILEEQASDEEVLQANGKIDEYLNQMKSDNREKDLRRSKRRLYQVRNSSDHYRKFDSAKPSIIHRKKIQECKDEELISKSYLKDLRSKKLINLMIGLTIALNIILSTISINTTYIKMDEYVVEIMKEQETIIFTEQILNSLYQRQLTEEENIIRTVNCCIALMMVVLLLFSYIINLRLLKEDNLMSMHENIISSGLFKSFLSEAFLLIISMPPYINKLVLGKSLSFFFIYDLNSFITIFTYFKSYFFFKVYSMYSKWTSTKATTICNKFKVKTGLHFTLKSDLKLRPAISIVVLVTISILFFSSIIRVAEYGLKKIDSSNSIEGSSSLQHYSNCVWLIAVTMTTVGYGDEVPVSSVGRLVGVVSCITGMILISLLVFSFGLLIEFSIEERNVYLTLTKMKIEDKVKDKAAFLIRNVLFVRSKLNNMKVVSLSPSYTCTSNFTNKSIKRSLIHYINSNQEIKLQFGIIRAVFFLAIYNLIQDFEYLQNLVKGLPMPTEELISAIQKRFNCNINSLLSQIKEIKTLENNLIDLNCKQNQINNSLCNVLAKQEKLSEFIVQNNNSQYGEPNFFNFFEESDKQGKPTISTICCDINYNERNSQSSSFTQNNDASEGNIEIANK